MPPVDLAGDVADHTAQPHIEEFDLALVAFELFGMSVTLRSDQGQLTNPRIGLALFDPMAPAKPSQTKKRFIEKLCVGREGDVFRLNRRVDGHAPQIFDPQSARALRRAEAFLDQLGEFVLAQTLTPARHGRAVERRFMLEKHLAAKMLIIGVLDPAICHLWIGQAIHIFENVEPHHQTRR